MKNGEIKTDVINDELEPIENELSEEIFHHAIIFKTDSNDKTIIDRDESRFLRTLKNIEQIMIAIRSSRMSEFSASYRKNSYEMVSTKIGEKLINILKFERFDTDEYCLHQERNPLITMFIELVNKCHIKSVIGRWFKFKFTNTYELNNCVRQLNQLVQNLRMAMRDSYFLHQYKNYFRRGIKNRKSAIDLVNTLFARHSKLMIVRIDLRYQNPVNSALPLKEQSPITFAETRQHREQFFKQIYSQPFGKYIVGWSWKLEWGFKRGFHYHVIFYFNGARVRQDVIYGRLLGEFWKNEITGGLGDYHNCNAAKSSYKYPGIGTIHRDDTEAKKGLDKAINYLTKSEHYVRLMMDGKHRAFGRSNLC